MSASSGQGLPLPTWRFRRCAPTRAALAALFSSGGPATRAPAQRLGVEHDRAPAVELDEAVTLRPAQHAVHGRARRPGERGQVFLPERDGDGRLAAVDADELEQPPHDPLVGVDGVRLDEQLGQPLDLRGEKPHEHLVERRVLLASRRSSEPRTTSVSPGSSAVTVAVRSSPVSRASSPNVSPGPRMASATTSPSAVPMQMSKRPLLIR